MATELDRVRKFERLAHHHMESANRALLQPTLISSPKLKFFDAISLWHKAGKCFSIAGEWEDSAIAFARAAEFMAKVNANSSCLVPPSMFTSQFPQMGCAHEAAVYWHKCAEIHRRIDPIGSIQRYDKSIEGYIEISRFGTAANITVCIAEIYEEQRMWDEVGSC
jgi:hypothetical protein